MYCALAHAIGAGKAGRPLGKEALLEQEKKEIRRNWRERSRQSWLEASRQRDVRVLCRIRQVAESRDKRLNAAHGKGEREGGGESTEVRHCECLQIVC